MDQNKIGNCIEKYRKEKGLTQQQLADILGVSNTAVSKWEHGNNLPDISMLEPLSEALGIDMLELITAQNNAHEECSKKLQKVRRAKLRRTIVLSLIFLSIICITNIFTYNRVMFKRKEDLSNAIEIYKISSLNKDFIIEGYIFFNSKENKIFLEKIKYQGSDYTDLKYSKYSEVKYYIKVNKEIILKVRQELQKNRKNNELNDIVKQINLGVNESVVDLKKFNSNFKDVTLLIELTNQEKTDQIEVELVLNREFI